MQYRHELKTELNKLDCMILSQRLRAVMKPDRHMIGGINRIRSLYFDTPEDKALLENLNGVSRREKFRIRYYNGDTGFIRLEKKYKVAGLGTKIQAMLTKEQAQSIVDGDIDWMKDSPEPLIKELYAKMKSERLAPKVIVDYTRQAFTYSPGNVRVTLDYDIRTGLFCKDFLNPDVPTLPAPNSGALLEVKWDEFLPSVIRDSVQLPGRHTSAFSKYAACRMYD